LSGDPVVEQFSNVIDSASHNIRRGAYTCLSQQNNVTGMVMRALNVLVLASSESLIVLDMFSGLIRGMLTIISAAAARLYIVDEYNNELNMCISALPPSNTNTTRPPKFTTTIRL
jgi:hypothetical protein